MRFLDNIQRANWLTRHAENYIPVRDQGRSLLAHIKLDHELINKCTNSAFEQDFLETWSLAEKSPLHRTFDYLSIMQYIVYPMIFGFYVLHRENNQPVSYLSWAFLDPKIADIYIDSNQLIPDADVVRSGTNQNIWIVDVIAPTGRIMPLVRAATNWGKQHHVPQQWLKFVRRYSKKRSRRNQWSLRYKQNQQEQK